jgi:EAL domain-containing protein (putative c-di-GMP-specific phosphodiesterase class I)
VDFAKKLEIECIAEFVHSSTVLDRVKELGIKYSQGFYIDEPLQKI